MLLINCKAKAVSVDGNDTAYRYFTDIRKFKQLSDREQKDLLYIIKNGTESESIKARQKLIECNQRFVASAAKHLTNGEDFNDLVSEGTLGLNKAIDKFNLDYKQRFITYAAFWINKYMVDYLIGDAKLVVPKNANKIYAYVSKANNKFFLENCRYPTTEELQEILKEQGVIFSKKEDLIPTLLISVEEIEPDNNDGETKLSLYEDFLDLTSSNNIENNVDRGHVKSLVNEILSHLTDRQRFIITHYYGIGCESEPLSLISIKLDTTERKITNEFNKTLEKLKEMVKLKID